MEPFFKSPQEVGRRRFEKLIVVLTRLLLVLALSAYLPAKGRLDRLRELWHRSAWAEAEQLVRETIAEHPEPTDLESIAGFSEGYEMLRLPSWPETQAAYFARLDRALAARPRDIPYEFHCRGIKEQWARSTAIANRSDFAQVAALDEANTARLKEIVAEQGWPRRSVWGIRPALAAWMILQHTPDYEFQAEMLPVMEKMVGQKELDAPYYALLYDRVQLRNDRPQRYGSQLRKKPDGSWEPAPPLEDADQLDVLRASVGLQPIAEYLHEISKIYDQPAKHGWFR